MPWSLSYIHFGNALIWVMGIVGRGIEETELKLSGSHCKCVQVMMEVVRLQSMLCIRPRRMLKSEAVLLLDATYAFNLRINCITSYIP